MHIIIIEKQIKLLIELIHILGGEKIMATSNSSKRLVPEAKEALDKFKYEVASDMCVKNIFTLISTSYFILNPPSLRDTFFLENLIFLSKILRQASPATSFK